MSRNGHFNVGASSHLSVQMGARYKLGPAAKQRGHERLDPDVKRFKGQVVKLRSQEGQHPDFSDSSDRYYVSGKAHYGGRGLRLQGIPGHTNGSVDGVEPHKIVPVKERVKKYKDDL